MCQHYDPHLEDPLQGPHGGLPTLQDYCKCAPRRPPFFRSTCSVGVGGCAQCAPQRPPFSSLRSTCSIRLLVGIFGPQRHPTSAPRRPSSLRSPGLIILLVDTGATPTVSTRFSVAIHIQHARYHLVFFDSVPIHFDLRFFATHHIGNTPRATISHTSLESVATHPSHLNTSLDPALHMGYNRASRGLITRLTRGATDTPTNTIILPARMLVHTTCMSLQHQPSRSRHPLTRAARHPT